MSANATYRYAEDHGVGHHRRHNGTNRANVLPALGWWQPSTPKPSAWDDVANWKGKTVWGLLDGKRQQLLVMSIAPEGNEGERWYVMLDGGCLIGSVSKAKLELVNPYALAIVPDTSRIEARIKKAVAAASLTIADVIYI